MRRTLFIALLIAGALAACGPSPEDSAATAQALAQTIIAETSAALPTQTPPPSATPTEPAPLTETPTQPPAASPAPSLTPTLLLATESPTEWINPELSSKLRFENTTGKEIFLILNGPQYNQFTFTASWNFDAQWGDYTYLVWIDGEGPYSGTFRMHNVDKHTLLILDDRVNFHYP
jgi:hypothetical protein